MASAVLELAGVRKRYDSLVAVDDLDLALEAGEFLTLLGPSGSGKTTTLMMVAGLQQPDAGSIRLNGVSVASLPPYRRDVGMVFQNYALFPHMTVRRNVAFPLEMRGTPAAEIARLVDEALALVKLPDHGERLPKQLSGGQQQRVALARAMVYRPALLLMDEPLGALDRKLREQLQLEIKRVHRERRISVLYVTHDQEEALTMSDRIAVFNKGRIEQIGTPEELYDRPATRFVASFIGDTNLVEGRVLGVAGGICEIETAAGRIAASARTPLEAGAAVFVAVRPERVVLAPVQAAGGGLEGVIIEQVFLGTSRKYVVRLADGTELVVLRPISDPPFEQAAPTVRVSWPPEKATAFSG
ncbi:MAG: putative spermidine/putrescine transport system ATP-binding protein [Rhodospirillaceae bacterium]|jgi:putative spermidine/putrescine transport system ATP-binding protein|nr:putative spermidine/putrescine transport system ATP-binding protein [Rhodospirillaceae bacterium]